jgi:hypothetical protein
VADQAPGNRSFYIGLGLLAAVGVIVMAFQWQNDESMQKNEGKMVIPKGTSREGEWQKRIPPGRFEPPQQNGDASGEGSPVPMVMPKSGADPDSKPTTHDHTKKD